MQEVVLAIYCNECDPWTRSALRRWAGALPLPPPCRRGLLHGHTVMLEKSCRVLPGNHEDLEVAVQLLQIEHGERRRGEPRPRPATSQQSALCPQRGAVAGTRDIESDGWDYILGLPSQLL